MMTIFEDIIRKNADNRLVEEMLYAEAIREVEQGKRRDGLWGKALAESDGDEKKAKSYYLKLCVQSLKDDLERERIIQSEKIKAEQDLKDKLERERVRVEEENAKHDGVGFFKAIGIFLCCIILFELIGSSV